ncbi:MAG: thioredoxin domain-containing protein [Polyangiaceae bacterium]|nr:thioredoxin domain-containing protein [Polyangiaceae bacterium]
MVASTLSKVLLTAAFAGLGFSTCRGPAESGGAAGGAKSAVPVSDVSLPGVDTSSLTPRERREWSTYVSEVMAPCADTPVSLAVCVKEQRKCPKCVPGVKYLMREVRDGRTREQAVDSFKTRFDPDRAKSIDVSDTPMKGPASAPVTIVEWADFECPACKAVAPKLDEAVARWNGKIKVYYKNYPLSIHRLAEPAARAGYAAMQQGKFWEMHHVLFDKQPALEVPDLEKYAKDLGLDLVKWKADMGSEAAAARVTRDKKQGDAVGLDHTPTIFINGREFRGGDLDGDLDEWVKLELELAGDTTPIPAKAAPSASAPAPALSVPQGKR